MENNTNGPEDEIGPSRNRYDINNNSWQKSYIGDEIPKNGNHEESEEEEIDGPFSKLYQRISDVPGGGKDDTNTKDNSKEENQTSDDRAK